MHKTDLQPEAGSDRSFGFTFAVALTVVALWPLTSGSDVRWWALLGAFCFLAAALMSPSLLHGLNLLWFRFGLLLHRIMTPIIMGLLFFCVFTPIGWWMRLAGKDPLRLQWQPDAKSYWISRNPPGPEPETLKNQF